MLRLWRTTALALTCWWISSGAAVSAEEPELLVIVHPSSPAQTLSHDELLSIFTLTQRRWSNGDTIVPLNYEVNTPLRVFFDRIVLQMAPEDVGRFWVDNRIRGQSASPRKVPTTNMMLRVVQALPGAIGYVPAGMLTTGVRVVAKVRSQGVVPPGAR